MLHAHVYCRAIIDYRFVIINKLIINDYNDLKKIELFYAFFLNVYV